MILILEGPDGSGKTTLAHQLCKKFGLRYHHEGPPPVHRELEHYGRLLEGARKTGDVLFDRFALGERVYGPIMRNHDGLGRMGWRLFRRHVWAAGALEILCLPPFETCLANWKARKGREYVADEGRFREVYDGFYQRRGFQFIYVYTEPDAFTRVCRIAENFAMNALTLPLGMVGHPHARHLLVGERGGNPDALDLPFFSLKESPAYLNRALELAGFDERDMAFMNAYPNRSQVPREIPKNFERVIALGNIAALSCERQGVSHCHVPHPQYYRRFHHHEIQSYANLLKQCHL